MFGVVFLYDECFGVSFCLCYGNGDKKARRESTPGKINMVRVRGSAQDRSRELGRLRVQRRRQAKKKTSGSGDSVK